ncbi:MAG: D-alanine--D-alanine ligase [Bacteroidales bacterium]|jgi:D-alanine-D-alanine ligase|nr:D-alanine--D-alanine ligase [Bacteroidales bacterium]
MNIAILAGGPSSERVISLQTAANISQKLSDAGHDCFTIDVNGSQWIYDISGQAISIDKNDFSLGLAGQKLSFDYVVIAIHGKQGEDGLLQGYFDVMNIPYSSPGVLASALTYDKIRCKQFLSNLDVPMAAQCIIRKGDTINADEIVAKLGLPVFVKPNTAGSSFGVTKVYEKKSLEAAIHHAYTEDVQVIIEEFIKGVEVSCGVIKTRDKDLVLPVTEIDTKRDFFDYDAKYDPELTDEITPARISEDETKAVQKLTSRIYDLTGCKGLVRVDFIIKNEIPFFLELNTIPGLSPNSIVPKQVRSIGMTEREILVMAMEDSLLRHRTHAN